MTFFERSDCVMKRLCALLLAVAFAFSLSFAQDAMKPQDTKTPPAKNEMKMDKKKMTKKMTKKMSKDKMMKKDDTMKKDNMK
jgi:pentapeptide MXKDX repeat protein